VGNELLDGARVTFLDAIHPGALRGNQQVFCHFWSRGTVTALTFDALFRGSAAYAARYKAAGAGRGDVVLIALPHSPDLLYAFFGAMIAGYVPSFMPPPTVRQDPSPYWSSHRRLFERIGSGVIVTCRANADDVHRSVQELTISVLLSDEVEDRKDHSDDLPAVERGASDVAFLQHSSGTTGLKKGVELSFEAVDRQIEHYASAIELSADDCIVSWLPLYHDMGLIACLVLPFTRRVPLVLLDPFEWVERPALLFEAIGAHGGTLVWLPNFAFHHLARTVRDDARVDLGGVRAFINCSEPCKLETFEIFAERFTGWGVRPEQLQVCYAMAEGVFAVTQTPLGQPPCHVRVPAEEGVERVLLSVGSPIGDWRVRVVDSEGVPLTDGAIGEIAIAGGSLFSGYHRQPEETVRKFRGEWYLTGDLGCVREERLFITGRVDDLIIVHGKNVYAHEVEYVANQVPGIKPGRTVAIGVFAAEAGTQELLVIAESPEAHLRERRAALSRAVKAAVLQHIGLTPRSVHIVEAGWLVKTTSGKINRKDNLRKYLESQSVTIAS
jgi:fatty-acyl-CoA synthase